MSLPDALKALVVLLACGGPAFGDAEQEVKIGSKQFTESVILGELGHHLIRRAGVAVDHKRGLGGTRVLWRALLAGEIDLYPEYTGTLRQEILAVHGQRAATLATLADRLSNHGVRMTAPLGFNNTYALGMREAQAAALGIETISDLRAHADLRFGFSNEFMDRADGWPGLRQRYRLPQQQVIGLEHDIAYRALARGEIDISDLYSTDAEIRYYGLRVLRDDRGFFPDYQAVYLYRAELLTRQPKSVAALSALEYAISQSDMIAMNAQAKLEKVAAERIAGEFLKSRLGLEVSSPTEHPLGALGRHTLDHIVLVAVSLGLAIVVAVPLGVLSARHPRLGQVILGIVGILQTIPSLALLVFMIPLFGIGGPPAVAALFLYSLLPIVRNTYTGLRDIPAEIIESARALGLPRRARLRLVELPLVSPAVLAGIKTAAVINVGTATLGALIGAGGYGQPILTGIRLDDIGLILQGAIPAAGLALAVQGLFELLERRLVPQGLRAE